MIDFKSFVALPALSALTIVMGMDNILTVAVITSRVTPALRARTRLLGLFLAMLSRLIVLAVLIRLMRGNQSGWILNGHRWALGDLVKFAGGAFLIGKSLRQILHRTLQEEPASRGVGDLSIGMAAVQILFADQTQSLDSLLSVVGMAPSVAIMIAAILVELVTILLFAAQVSRVIARYPSVQTIAVCALLLVGCVMISESIHRPIARHYVYLMMTFSLAVEAINIRMAQRVPSQDQRAMANVN